jgi:competence protein ComEA
MLDIKEYLKYWYIPVICLLAAALMFVYVRKPSSTASGDIILTESTEEVIQVAQTTLIHVDVSGAVNLPGFYALPAESRVVDLVNTAGGFSTNAHSDYVSRNINLSEKLFDGEKIYIPFVFDSASSLITEEISAQCFSSTVDSSEDDPSEVDVNSATQEQLVALPGIGDVTADKIVKGRPYTTIDAFYSYIKFSSKTKTALEGILVAK